MLTSLNKLRSRRACLNPRAAFSALSCAAVFSAAALVFAPTSSHAAVDSWTGATNSNWSNTGNWNPAVPGSTTGTTNTDTATFGSTTNTTVTLDNTYNLQNIVFGSVDGGVTTTTSPAYTISNSSGSSTSGNAFLLTAGGAVTNYNTSTSGFVYETINAPITLEGAYTFASNGASTVATPTTSTTTASGITPFFTAGIGSVSTANNFLVFNGNITSGVTTAGTTTLTLSGTDYVPLLQQNQVAPTTAAPIANTISGIISDNSTTSTTAVSLTGSTWVLSGTNTYTGGTTINGASVYMGNSNTFGSNTNANSVTFAGLGGTLYNQTNGIGINNNLVINTGATATILGANQLNLSGTISGGGSLYRGGTGTDVIGVSSNTYTGGTYFIGGYNNNSTTVNYQASNNSNLSIAADGSLGTGVIGFNGSGTLSVFNNTTPITLATGHGTIYVAGGALATNGGENYIPTATFTGGSTAATEMVIPNAIGGSGNVTTNGFVVLSGANTFQSVTIGGTLQLSGSGTLGIGYNVGQNFGGITDNVTLDLNGTSQTTDDYLNGSGTITNTGTAASTLTVGAVGNAVFGGKITDGTSATTALTIQANNSTSLDYTRAESLSNNSTYSGNTTLEGGYLNLNFGASGATATNLIGTSSKLVLNGGYLNGVGAASATNSQTFASTTVAEGSSAVIASLNATAGTNFINLGGITRNTGSSLLFVPPTTTNSSTNGILTSTGTASTLLTDPTTGAAYAVTAATTSNLLNNATDWAAKDSSNTYIVPGSSISGFYTTVAAAGTIANGSTTNVDLTGTTSTVAGSATTTIASLRLNAALGSNTASTVTIGSGGTLATGGILLGSGIQGNLVITGGSLTAKGSELTLLNYTQYTLDASNTVITNNGSTAVSVTRGGGVGEGNGAPVNLNNANTYTGATYLNAGYTNANLFGNEGTSGGTASSFGGSSNAASNLVLNGATIQYSGATASTDRLFSVGLNGASIQTNPAINLTFTNTGAIGFNGQSGARTLILSNLNSGSTDTMDPIIGDNGGPTSVYKANGGVWVLAGANTYSGVTTVGGGTLRANAEFALNNGSTTIGSGAFGNGTSTLDMTGGTVDLNGTDQTVGTFLSSGTTSVIQNNALAAASLTIGNGVSTNSAYSGTIIDGTFSGGASGGVSLIKNGVGSGTIPIVSGALGYTSSQYFGAQTTITGGGAITLNGANTYTGATTVNNGTLVLDSANTTTPRLAGTTSITLNNGGTLLLANLSATTTSGIQGATTSTDRINNAANVTINSGGRFATGGLTEGGVTTSSGAVTGTPTAGMGMLTLTSTSATAPAIIDFGGGANGSALVFSSLASTSGQYADILNWTGKAGIDGGTATNDRLLFTTNPGLTNAQLASIQFFGDSGQFLGSATEISFNGDFELVPAAVPEPSTLWSAVLGLAMTGLAFARRFGRKAA